MAINVSGAAGGPRSDINITPLVDVVLVLLIIFMVITPIVQLGYDVQVPPKLETAAVAVVDQDQVIVRMDREGLMYINKMQVPASEFPGRLQQAMTGRSKKVVFFAADGELPYDRVADFMDVVRDNGVENLGIVFEDLGKAPGVGQAVGAR
ncbi:MAG TPA: biopolymer transporter ExbD [Thermoanaerobaculia bacterium]|nr:biopolymer transporter ExbD [Thermoanaerobaculia bacterium]